MPSNLDELTALAMVQDGGFQTDTTVDDIKCDKVEEPSWIKADLNSFCDVLGISASTLRLFTKVIDRIVLAGRGHICASPDKPITG